MLILTRKSGERITIGDDIVITVLEIKGGQVRLGVEAPREVEVHREEIYKRIQAENRMASMISPSDLSQATRLLGEKIDMKG